jgi:hypothetical protein
MSTDAPTDDSVVSPGHLPPVATESDLEAALHRVVSVPDDSVWYWVSVEVG